MPVGSLPEPVSNPRLGPHSLYYLVARVSREYQLRQRTVTTISLKQSVHFFLPGKCNKIVNSLEWFTFCPSIIPCLKEHNDHWGTRSVPIFRLKLILTPTCLGTVYKAISWALLDVPMWIGIIFKFSYRTGTNLSTKHSVFISITRLWTKYIK